MHTEVIRLDHAKLVVLSGELDADTAGGLRTLLAEELLDGPSDLVIDLSDLGFIDSAGLGTLIAASKGAHRAGVELVLAGPVPAVKRVMRLTGIDVVLASKDSVDDALAHLDARR